MPRRRKNPAPDDSAADNAPADLTSAENLKPEFLKPTLDLFQDKVEHPERYEEKPIAGWQIKFLEKHRPELFTKPEEKTQPPASKEPSDLCDTKKGLAARMAAHYTDKDGNNLLDITIFVNHVKEWQALRCLGDRNIPPPQEINPGAKRPWWSLKAYIAWFDATLWHKHKKATAPENQSVEARESLPAMEDKARWAAARKTILETERYERENNEKWTLTNDAEIACIGLAKRFLAITRDEVRNAFLKIDISRGDELIDALDKKYQEAAVEIKEADAELE